MAVQVIAGRMPVAHFLSVPLQIDGHQVFRACVKARLYLPLCSVVQILFGVQTSGGTEAPVPGTQPIAQERPVSPPTLGPCLGDPSLSPPLGVI